MHFLNHKMDIAVALLLQCFVLFAIYQTVWSYRMEIDKWNEAHYCKYRSHLTLKPTATCCANRVIIPGINLDEHWGTCVQELRNKEPKPTSVEDVTWNMYGCILGKSIEEGKEEITLQEFSNIVTAQYPDDIKTKIDEEVGKQTTPAAGLSDFEKLNKIRVTYYDIETAICEGTTQESYGEIDANCSAWEEENHRAGFCCKQAYPVDLNFESTLEIETKQRRLNSCYEGKLHETLVELGATELMEGHILEMCDVACLMEGNGINLHDDILNNREYWKFNVTVEIDDDKNRKWLPAVIPEGMVREAKQYVESMYTVKNTSYAIQNYLFADVIETESHTSRPHHETAYIGIYNTSGGIDNMVDFLRRKFHGKIMHIPVLCAAYKDIVALMEHFISGYCESEREAE